MHGQSQLRADNKENEDECRLLQKWLGGGAGGQLSHAQHRYIEI